ncbi:hypothetical protein NA57DRAFT_76646 [Rhizodiscina lignyota]|uniref:MARVEL domain-containing protein n=1 Tax=Rhizodiscina lignyota TaxID=1504668 RepID=A0A9P4M9J0_9PEZI|nr:hypothetical protein NA57DRAFT_76646 [Rhizodiscina lignyota]
MSPLTNARSLLRRDNKSRTKPTNYPFLLFHGLRCAQLTSSIIVAAIMFYFIWHLTHDHWPTPWTFLLLCGVSMATILALTTTIVLHCCCGLNPRFNIVLNSALCTLWAVGFALLSWWSSGTLTHTCSLDVWREDAGIMVCRIYKSLFAFAMLGFVSTLAALFLDIYVLRRATRLGKYNQMNDIDRKSPYPAPRNLEDDAWDLGRGSTDVWAPGSENIEQPRPFSDPAKNVSTVRAGYEVPEEQFNYDTGYQGGGGMGSHRGERGFETVRVNGS